MGYVGLRLRFLCVAYLFLLLSPSCHREAQDARRQRKNEVKQRRAVLSRALLNSLDKTETLTRDAYRQALKNALLTPETTEQAEQELWAVVDAYATKESEQYRTVMDKLHHYEQNLYANHYQFFETLQQDLQKTQDKELLSIRLDSLYALHQLGQYYAYNTLVHYMTCTMAVDLVKSVYELPAPSSSLPIRLIDWFAPPEEENAVTDERQAANADKNRSSSRGKKQKSRRRTYRKRLHENKEQP